MQVSTGPMWGTLRMYHADNLGSAYYDDISELEAHVLRRAGMSQIQLITLLSDTTDNLAFR
jgi:hypothetical protein